MTYRITGLDPQLFTGLYGLSDEALNARGARRMIADAKPGFPDRVALRDAEPGEAVILLHHEHQPADTPFARPTPSSSSKARPSGSIVSANCRP